MKIYANLFAVMTIITQRGSSKCRNGSVHLSQFVSSRKKDGWMDETELILPAEDMGPLYYKILHKKCFLF